MLGDGLNDHQHGRELERRPVKKDLTLDLLMIMLDKVMVKFKTGQDKYDKETGRWCQLHKK